MSAALFAVPAVAQDATSSDGYNRDQHFNGLYIQGFGGVGLNGNNSGGTVDFDTNRDGAYGDNVTTVTGANAFSPGYCSGAASGPTRLSGAGCVKDTVGKEYGARIGFDSRMGNLVAGALIEGSRNETEERATAFSTTPASYTFTRSVDYAISARARVGFTPGGGALFYATGGGSYARIDHDFSTSNTANSFAQSDENDMVWGWQAGGGTEIMLTDNISFGAEYLYTRYNDNKYEVNVGPGTAPPTNPFLLNGGGTNMRVQDKYFNTHAFRAVVGLRF